MPTPLRPVGANGCRPYGLSFQSIIAQLFALTRRNLFGDLPGRDCINEQFCMAWHGSVRKQLALALVEGRRIVISGGNFTLESTVSGKIARKRLSIMRIAVTYENGQIYQHFGKTEQFRLYNVADGEIINEQVIGTNGAEYTCGDHGWGKH